MAVSKSNSSYNKIVLTIIFVLLGALIIYIYTSPLPVNWSPLYRTQGEDPYDTKILNRLLQKVRNDQTFYSIFDSLEIRLADSSELVDNYIFIGNDYYVDSTEIQSIKRFLEKGNKVFVFLEGRYNPLLSEFVHQERGELYLQEEDYDDIHWVSNYMYQTTDTNTLAQVGGITVPYSAYRDYEKCDYEYYYFLDSLFLNDSTYMESLGTYQRPNDLGGEDTKYPEFIRFKFGEGELYLHSNPIRFTNYYCLNDTLVPYIQEVFSYLGDGKIIWDEDSKNFEFNKMEPEPQLPKEGPLEFILSEPSLRRAWYVLIAGVLLYLAFGAKRKQRVIPVVENKENTSIEYAETIAQLFMKQEDHSKLVKLKAELFKSYIRERLKMYVPVHSELWDENMGITITQRSGVRRELVETIITQCKKYETPSGVNTENMMAFHNNLEEFYFYCK